jgi:hypothetical protein
MSGIARVASANCEALTVDRPTTDQLEACLSSRPLLVSSVGGSLAISDSGARGGLFVTVDIPIARPLYVSARSHLGSQYSDVDALVGWVLRESYGRGRQTFSLISSTYEETVTTVTVTTTTEVHSREVVQRGALVLLAGLKGVSRSLDGSAEKTFDMGNTYELGLAYHHANHVGSHSRIEAFAVTRDGKFGGVVTWHNSVPATGRWVVGMEVGYVPVLGANDTTTHTFYWNFVDLGISFEL